MALRKIRCPSSTRIFNSQRKSKSNREISLFEASLKGEAANVIQNLDLAEQYYPIARKSVVERYEKKIK